MGPRRREVGGKLVDEFVPGPDGISAEVFVPVHGTSPQRCDEELALHGSSDVAIVEHGLNVFDVLVGISCPVVCVHLGGLFQPRGYARFPDSASERAESCMVVIRIGGGP